MLFLDFFIVLLFQLMGDGLGGRWLIYITVLVEGEGGRYHPIAFVEVFFIFFFFFFSYIFVFCFLTF